MRALILAILVHAALLQPAEAAVEDYDSCAALATTEPERALNEARAWREETGAPGALHCQAIALVELDAPRAAADVLRELANAPELAPGQRAAVLIQAAALWSDAGAEDAARAALDAAVEVDPTPASLVERSTFRVAFDDLSGAAEDLDRAHALSPGSAEVLTLRAAVKRRRGDAVGARDDALAALETAPGSGAAWFELGMAEKALGVEDGARRSLLKAIDVDPDGAAARFARRALQDLDG